MPMSLVQKGLAEGATGRHTTNSLAKRIAAQRRISLTSAFRYGVEQTWLSYPSYPGRSCTDREPGRSEGDISATARRVDQLEIELRHVRVRLDEAYAERVAADLDALARPATAVMDVSTFIMGAEYPARSVKARRSVGRAAHRFVLRALGTAIFLSTTLLPWTFN